jgi:hypothetical protein|tara:strand:- start:48 stop:254 length:207 start_codon:yes stop_codon:yes gene_type:complete
MMLLIYPSKKELKTQIGQPLRYEETSMFGDEYLTNGTFVGANRPYLTGMGREFFAEVTMENGFIKSVQ